METIQFRKIYKEDLALGTGTGTVKLADGRVVALTKIAGIALVSGTVTFTTGDTSASVTFADLGTSDYRVLPEFNLPMGMPWFTSKSSTGFTVNLPDPAGSGLTMKYSVLS